VGKWNTTDRRGHAAARPRLGLGGKGHHHQTARRRRVHLAVGAHTGEGTGGGAATDSSSDRPLGHCCSSECGTREKGGGEENRGGEPPLGALRAASSSPARTAAPTGADGNHGCRVRRAREKGNGGNEARVFPPVADPAFCSP